MEMDVKPYLSPPPPPAAFLFFLSTLANPAMFTATLTTAPGAPDVSDRFPSAGPWTVQRITVLPIERYDDPELAGFVDI